MAISETTIHQSVCLTVTFAIHN